MNKLPVLKLKIISKENPKMDPLHVQNQPSYDQRFTIVKKKFTTVFNYERVILERSRVSSSNFLTLYVQKLVQLFALSFSTESLPRRNCRAVKIS